MTHSPLRRAPRSEEDLFGSPEPRRPAEREPSGEHPAEPAGRAPSGGRAAEWPAVPAGRAPSGGRAAEWPAELVGRELFGRRAAERSGERELFGGRAAEWPAELVGRELFGRPQVDRPTARRSVGVSSGERAEQGVCEERGLRRWPWAVAGALAMVSLVGGALAMSGGGARPVVVSAAVPSRSAGGAQAPRALSVAALARMGADGVFLATVTRVTCGAEVIGPAGARQRAEGKFCLVELTLENAGRHEQLLDTRAQRVVDTRGRAYAVAGRAVAFLNDRRPGLLENVPAGRSVRGVLPFDVPARARLSALVLHGSAGGRGARVPLS